MAGHSKWANIKHQKAKADAKKGKLFSRITKEIISAVKQGGADPKSNPRLRTALLKAKAVNLPNENVERNIKKATSADQADYSPVVYELYGFGGVGIIAEAMTDNKNRTASDIRIAINKNGGSIATPGSVAFNFDRKGVLQVAKKQLSEEQLFEALAQTDAEDFEMEEEFYFITTAPEKLAQVKEQLAAQNIAIEEAELQMIPKTLIECDEAQMKENMQLIEYLEGLDDIDTVTHNMKM